MIIIVYTMSNGQKIVQSKSKEGASYYSLDAAYSEMTQNLENSKYIKVDNGVVIMCAQVATAQVIDDAFGSNAAADTDPAAFEQASSGQPFTCAGCGRQLMPGSWCPDCNVDSNIL
jgi:hypothetical protein